VIAEKIGGNMRDPKIIYEAKDFIALDKPAGLLVHAARVRRGRRPGGRIEEEPTLVDWLLKHCPEVATVGDDPVTRPGIVHRLDKDTSGVMLVAKTQEYFEYLKSLFQEHRVEKTYYALVRGVPKPGEGVIDKPIGITNGTLKRSVRSAKMQKDAVTDYRVVKTFAVGADQTLALVEVKPKTGRTHQIRVHMASIGCPLVGDRLYGPKVKGASGRLMLHAASIAFREKSVGDAVVTGVVHIESELPEGFSTGVAIATNK
jgi:23S rRNA pseudouridine1911/1915/1917 synthase